MKSNRLITISILAVFFTAFCSIVVYASEDASTIAKALTIQKKPEYIRQVTFDLRDGTMVYGKVILEDRKKIILEQLDQSRITVNTYSKKDVERRTLKSKRIPEAKHFMDLGDYFAGRVWDFKDDPDDFIQSIRLYNKAIDSLTELNPGDNNIQELNRKIKKLQADRQVWIKEAQSRAKLKRLELEAVVETRLKEMNAKINSITQDLQQIGDLSEFSQRIETSLNDLANNIATLNEDMTTRLQDLENRIATNERLIDRLDRSSGRISSGRYYYPRIQND